MAKKTIEIIHKKPSELKLTFGNPRKITDKEKAKLKESIEKLGDFGVIVINASNQVISGNQRVQVMQEMDLDVPVACKQLKGYSIGEQKIINIRANKSSGDFEENELNEWLKEINDEFGSIDLTGFNSFKLDNEVEEDGYEISEEIKTDIKVGDLFEIGEHRLLCGDSTNSDAMAKLMNGKRADIMVTDPPYGIDLETDYSKMGSTTSKYEKIKGDNKEFDLTHTILISGTKEQYIWGGDYFVNSLDWMKGTQIIWAKRHSEEENKVFGSAFESLWVSYKCKKLIWFIRPINQSSERLGQHPTQKPIECMRRCIELSKLQGVIYDAFLGSGTTMIASHQLKRKCYGMEIEPKYCQVIIDRMLKFDPSIKIKKNGVEYASR